MKKGTAMPLASYETPEHYNRLQRALAETQSGRALMLVTGVIELVSSLVTVTSVALVLLSWSPLAAVIALIAPIPSALLSAKYGRLRWSIEMDRTENRRKSGYLQWLTTNDHSAKEVSHYQLGPTLLKRYAKYVKQFLAQDLAVNRRSELWVGLVDLLGLALTTSALGIAVVGSVQRGSVGEIAGFIQAMGSLQTATSGFLLGLAALYQNGLWARNLFGYLELPSNALRATGKCLPFPSNAGIEFRNVSFSYPSTDRQVLDNLSFTLPAGSRTAIVGPNGAGKSTIVKLLTGLYVPDAGEVLIGGVPVKDLDPDEVRREVGVVFQDFVKYELTASDNIAFGNWPSATGEEVRGAAERAGIWGKLSNLPANTETLLGRRFTGAHQLSLGEWQKMALARAFVSGRKVLIMDEPSASLDPRAEADLVARIADVPKDTTAVVVAHRFATVRALDRIVVLDQGVITEVGDHDELMSLNGTYARMYEAQAAAFSESK
jgi:ATP-binding cassette subfamily B protein